MTSAVLPDSVVAIDKSAFENCHLSSIGLPESVLTIESYAFARSHLRSILIPSRMTSLGTRALADCPFLGSIRVSPDNSAYSAAGRIGVLFDKRRTKIIATPRSGGFGPRNPIPDTVTTIGDSAFYGCTNLTGVALPNGVDSIGDQAFALCPNLEIVFFEGDAPPEPEVFPDSPKATIYYLPDTAGWTDMWGGRPTVRWDARIESGHQFGMVGGQFGFLITGTPGLPVAVQACDDLKPSSWKTIAAYTLSEDSVRFGDSDTLAHPTRFYRLRAW